MKKLGFMTREAFARISELQSAEHRLFPGGRREVRVSLKAKNAQHITQHKRSNQTKSNRCNARSLTGRLSINALVSAQAALAPSNTAEVQRKRPGTAGKVSPDAAKLPLSDAARAGLLVVDLHDFPLLQGGVSACKAAG